MKLQHLIIMRTTMLTTTLLTLLLATPDLRSEAFLFLDYPAAGERVNQGDVIKIRWSEINVGGAIDIQVWQADHGTWYEVASGVDAHLGELLWQVPHSMRGKCRMRVVSTHDRSVSALGNTFFFIEEDGQTGGMALTQIDVSPIQLGPNPAGAQVSISWPLDIPAQQLIIFDLLGAEVAHLQTTGRHNITLATRDWPSGSYRVKLMGDGTQVWHATLLVQH